MHVYQNHGLFLTIRLRDSQLEFCNDNNLDVYQQINHLKKMKRLEYTILCPKSLCKIKVKPKGNDLQISRTQMSFKSHRKHMKYLNWEKVQFHGKYELVLNLMAVIQNNLVQGHVYHSVAPQTVYKHRRSQETSCWTSCGGMLSHSCLI